MSMLVGQTVLKAQAVQPDLEPFTIASALAVISGAIITFVGLIRCGWIVDFIPLTAISAFMTGSALTIIAGQIPTLMGITGFSTNESTYRVIINTLKHLPNTKIDAAMGLTALFLLYAIRLACNYSAKRYPSRARIFFFLATLRTVFIILLYTMVSWLVNMNTRDEPVFQILGTVPRGRMTYSGHISPLTAIPQHLLTSVIGFQHAAVPKVNKEIISAFSSNLPATIIVLLIEHIAISKSFGRVNNYTIDPSQELVAIGITNLLGPFLGAYPATGSFSRTAIKSKAGVRTPFGGVVTAMVVLLAIYALPAVFFYIPKSSLSAVIVHAVGDLITPPNTVYQFWRVSPLEVIIFFIGVFVTVFSSIENGIYSAICVSLAVLLFRVVKAQGQFLGRVTVHSVVGDHLVDNDGRHESSDNNGPSPGRTSAARNIFLPLNHDDGSNPDIEVDQPHPGIFIYRFSEGFNYPNANHYLDYLISTIYKETRRTNQNSYPRLGDRPWNNPGPKRGQTEADRSGLPTLKAVILDFSSVNNVDVTSIQNLIDVRNQLDHYASPQNVQWHFAHINNRWTKRALASAGFGYPTPPSDTGFTRWKPIFSVAEIGGSNSPAAIAEFLDKEREQRQSIKPNDIESSADDKSSSEQHLQPSPPTDQQQQQQSDDIADSNSIERLRSEQQETDLSKALNHSTPYEKAELDSRVAVVHGLNRPLFHIDLTSALQSALANTEDAV